MTAGPGRPTIRTPEIEDALLEAVAQGAAVRTWCRHPDRPSERTVRDWLAADAGFAERMRAAREQSAEFWDAEAERVLVEAEGSKEELMRAREIASHYRWRAKALAPRTYGERVDLNVTGTVNIAAQLAEVRARRALIEGAAEPIGDAIPAVLPAAAEDAA